MKNYYPSYYPILLPVLRHNSFAHNFCQGHTLNGSGAKPASILDAKIGLFTLTDPRQHKKYAVSTFIILPLTVSLRGQVRLFVSKERGIGYFWRLKKQRNTYLRLN